MDSQQEEHMDNLGIFVKFPRSEIILKLKKNSETDKAGLFWASGAGKGQVGNTVVLSTVPGNLSGTLGGTATNFLAKAMNCSRNCKSFKGRKIYTRSF